MAGVFARKIAGVNYESLLLGSDNSKAISRSGLAHGYSGISVGRDVEDQDQGKMLDDRQVATLGEA